MNDDCTVTENSNFVAKNNFGSKMKGEKILGIRWEENKDVLIIDLKELLDRALCYVPTKRSIYVLLQEFMILSALSNL